MGTLMAPDQARGLALAIERVAMAWAHSVNLAGRDQPSGRLRCHGANFESAARECSAALDALAERLACIGAAPDQATDASGQPAAFVSDVLTAYMQAAQEKEQARDAMLEARSMFEAADQRMCLAASECSRVIGAVPDTGGVSITWGAGQSLRGRGP